MENIPYFSVIVPAFQAEKTIKRCIDSIVNQSYTDFELIIINDGSTDQTYSICKEYESNNLVRVISQENKGISATRQLGLNLSRGQYIQFIDSDDWIDTSYFEDMYMLLKDNDYDVVILDYYAEEIKKSTYKSLGIKSLDRKDLVTGLATNIPGVLWNKVIKKDIFNKYNINFNSGLSYCEDWVVSYEMFNTPSKIFYYKKAFYHYDLYSNVYSLARIINEKTLKNRRDYIEYIEKIGVIKLYPKVFQTQFAAYAYVIIRSNLYHNSQYRKEFSFLRVAETYLPLYKKVVLYVASKLNLKLAYYLDYNIRKVMKKRR